MDFFFVVVFIVFLSFKMSSWLFSLSSISLLITLTFVKRVNTIVSLSILKIPVPVFANMKELFHIGMGVCSLSFLIQVGIFMVLYLPRDI